MNSIDPNKIHNRDKIIYEQSKRLADQLLEMCKVNPEKGRLQLIFGPCFSGKTLTVILLSRDLRANGVPFVAAQPAVDRPSDVYFVIPRRLVVHWKKQTPSRFADREFFSSSKMMNRWDFIREKREHD